MNRQLRQQRNYWRNNHGNSQKALNSLPQITRIGADY